MSNDTPAEKRCPKCGETKPLDAYSKSKCSQKGCQSYCKECMVQYRSDNADYSREYHRAYRTANREKVRRYMRKWKAANPEKVREHSHKDYIKRLEEIKERRRAYNIANAEAIRERQRAWKAADPDKFRASRRVWEATYRAKHPHHMRAKDQRRRAHKKGNGGEFTPEELAALRAIQNGICAYCKGQHKPNELAIDHVIPLKQGGRHEAANIVLACKSCNSSKCDRTPEQWTNRWYLRQPPAPRTPRKKKDKPEE